jgi:predicted ABC-type exoprotein transport system permease subunit
MICNSACHSRRSWIWINQCLVHSSEVVILPLPDFLKETTAAFIIQESAVMRKLFSTAFVYAFFVGITGRSI